MSHMATVVGKEVITRHRFAQKYSGGGNFVRVLEKYQHEVSKPVIWKGSLDDPQLKSGDLLYIDSLDITVKIMGHARTTGGGMRYYTNHIVFLPDDEETERSKIAAQKEKDEYLVIMDKEEEAYVTGRKRWFCK